MWPLWTVASAVPAKLSAATATAITRTVALVGSCVAMSSKSLNGGTERHVCDGAGGKRGVELCRLLGCGPSMQISLGRGDVAVPHRALDLYEVHAGGGEQAAVGVP